MSATNTQGQVRRTGCVKWFNNKAGYGFLSVVGGESDAPQDVFVHHSAIQVDKDQYKYLVQGEYVEFTLSPTEGGEHQWQASDIRGPNGGRLMCETRNEARASRLQHQRETGQSETRPRGPRPQGDRQQVRPPRQVQGQVQPRDGQRVEWVLVQRTRDDATQQRGPRPQGGRGGFRPLGQQTQRPRRPVAELQ
jgi:cold shock CspA family protein